MSSSMLYLYDRVIYTVMFRVDLGNVPGTLPSLMVTVVMVGFTGVEGTLEPGTLCKSDIWVRSSASSTVVKQSATLPAVILTDQPSEFGRVHSLRNGICTQPVFEWDTERSNVEQGPGSTQGQQELVMCYCDAKCRVLSQESRSTVKGCTQCLHGSYRVRMIVICSP